MKTPFKLPFMGPFLDLQSLGKIVYTRSKTPQLELDIHFLRQFLAATARNAAGEPLTVVHQNTRLSARDFEASVYQRAQLPVRDGSIHDLLNLCMWCVWPKTKSALNTLHAERGLRDGSLQRSPAGHAGTLLDECGVVIATTSDEPERLIREHQWSQLFVDQRDHWQSRQRAWALGHGMMEQMLTPYDGIMGKCVVLPIDPSTMKQTLSPEQLDDALSQVVNQLNRPRQLLAIPALGIPGWHSPNLDWGYYENTEYFQPLARRKSGPSVQ